MAFFHAPRCTVGFPAAACLALLVAGLHPLAHGTAAIYQTPDTYTLRNEDIELSFHLAGNKVSMRELVNHRAGVHYSLEGCGPRIHLRDGTVLDLSQFEQSVWEEKIDYADQQKGFAVSMLNPKYDIEILWEFELGHNDCFIRETVNISSATSDVLYYVDRVDLFAGPLGKQHERGGVGQPLFEDGSLFVGVADPVANNHVEGGSVVLSLSTARNITADWQTSWPVGTVVFGAAGPGEAQEAFTEEYVRRLRPHPAQTVVYNTRYDLSGDEVTPHNISSRLVALAARLREASGVLLDGALIEEDWSQRNSLLGFDARRFPDGLHNLGSGREAAAFNFGLGLSLSGGRMNTTWAKQQGYETDPSGRYLYMNGPRFQADLKQRLGILLRGDDLQFAKHVDVSLPSVLGASGEIVSATQGLSGNVHAFLDLAGQMKTEHGTIQWYAAPAWPSPWWMNVMDGLAISGPRARPPLDYSQPVVWPRDAAMTAAAGELLDFVQRNHALIPLADLVSDEIVASTQAGLGATDEALESWIDAVLLACARGSRIKELSVNADLLGRTQGLALGRITAWADTQRSLLELSRPYGGDPRRGEVYGFLAKTDTHALLVLRNPTLAATHQLVSLESMFGGRPGRFWAWIAYPYQLKIHERLNRSMTIDVPINGLETVVVEIEALAGASARRDLRSFWNVPVAATSYLTIASRGLNVARPISSGSASLKVEIDPLTQQAALGVLLRGTAKASAEYRLYVRINGASCAVERELSGPDWQMFFFPLAAGDQDVRVWLEENPTAAERKARTLSVWGLVAGIPDFVTPVLQLKSPADAAVLPAIHYPGHRSVTPIFVETALTQSVYRSTPLDGEAMLRRARGARILLQVFGSDAGSLAQKRVLLNGQPVGLLPPNQEPVDSWQAVTLAVPAGVLSTLALHNRLLVENPAGDSFKIKDIALMIETGVDVWKGSEMVHTVYCSSGDWPHKEGTVFQGKSPEIGLDFQVRRAR